MVDWKPGAARNRLQQRAQLLAAIRDFFAERQVLEVETPVLTATTGTDVYLNSFAVSAGPGTANPDTLYLQTSPEFAMKRLLAAGSGPIYQLGKAFRAGDNSRIHNPEFTMLEWYRPGLSLAGLMDEVAQLLAVVLDCRTIERIPYRTLFTRHLGFDPHTIAFAELQDIAHSKIHFAGAQLTATDYLQQLLAQCIEPALPEYCFIHDYPVAQAALAAIAADANGQNVAQRFELFGGGMEIANGYFELTDAAEQRARFLADNARRRQLNLPEYPLDEKLLAALDHGMPACAGVALGVDRLLMLITGEQDIRKIISFVE